MTKELRPDTGDGRSLPCVRCSTKTPDASYVDGVPLCDNCADEATGENATDEQITIPKLTAQILFDALVQSMDFGSGFLDTEEVEALRAMAVALGVDPAVATPAEFTGNYQHQFKPMDQAMIYNVFKPHVAVNTPAGWETERQGELPDFTPCMMGTWGRWCGKPQDDPIHQVGA